MKSNIPPPSDDKGVFVLTCPAHFPFSFARHSWLIVSRGGQLSRWEVLYIKGFREPSWGYLHRDAMKPFSGIPIVPILPARWRSQLLRTFKDAEAERLIQVIESSPQKYPWCERYYVSWVLEQAGIKLKIPRGVGQHYRDV
jgi:hypothetical protein